MKWYHEASLSVIFCDLSKGQTSPKKPQSPNASNNPKKPDIAPKAKICPKLPRKAKSTLDCPKGIKVKLWESRSFSSMPGAINWAFKHNQDYQRFMNINTLRFSSPGKRSDPLWGKKAKNGWEAVSETESDNRPISDTDSRRSSHTPTFRPFKDLWVSFEEAIVGRYIQLKMRPTAAANRHSLSDHFSWQQLKVWNIVPFNS